MSRDVVIGLHLYQPPRKAFHRSLRNKNTDPQGINWTKRITDECYRSLATNRSLERSAFDVSGVLHRELEGIDLNVAKLLRKAMRENGVGEPYLHPILPDLSRQDKQILITVGIQRFFEQTKERPRFFWGPESALDLETLTVLAESGYEAVICAPEQIRRDDGWPADNHPTRIQLGHGRSIIAYPFDRPISSELGYGSKANADAFASTSIRPAMQRTNGSPLLTWTDGETFGHHSPFGDMFLQRLLLQSLYDQGLAPRSINQIELPKDCGIGKLIERSSWSCPHGDLRRWHGQCGCCSDDARWKAPFYRAFAELNEGITQIITKQFGKKYLQLMATNFIPALENPGGRKSTPELSLLSAKASSLASRTSCGTFFNDPHASGRINLLFGQQALVHLREAGLTHEADKLEDRFRKTLATMEDPTQRGRNGVHLLDMTLR